jgi:hypothetical protein
MCISSAPTAAARSIVERANAPNRNGIVLAYGFGRAWATEFVVRASKLDCLRTRASSVRKSPLRCHAYLLPARATVFAIST